MNTLMQVYPEIGLEEHKFSRVSSKYFAFILSLPPLLFTIPTFKVSSGKTEKTSVNSLTVLQRRRDLILLFPITGILFPPVKYYYSFRYGFSFFLVTIGDLRYVVFEYCIEEV